MKESIITSREDLLEKIKEYNPNAKLELIGKAYDFAKKAHEGQKRASGEDFFIHPLAVANILVKQKSDSAMICAALLHDVVEDTKVTQGEIKKEFGEEISTLVAGVTKINAIYFESRAEYSAENIRKVVLATSKDIRVIIIKLADKLHNMRTAKYLPEKNREVISKEVLDIYAPIAYKLGMYRLKSELEDLSLRYLSPMVYLELKNKIKIKKEERDHEMARIVGKIKAALEEKGINAVVYGRTKHFYSIYKKMMARERTFDEIHDLYAIRIITNSVEECYSILGLIHSIWRPIPGGLDDYIANPKQNLYQSIHTEVVFEGKPVEIQIRTMEMHHAAEDGIAAHWRYKGTERDKRFDQKITWLKHILDWKAQTNAKDFIETLKVDLFGNEIMAFTPKGDIINLPEGATPIDFAYAVHTDIGNHCLRAKVNKEIVPLEQKLKSGDIVEIVTSKNAKPSRNWLKFIKTSLAKSEIRQALNIKGVQQDFGEEEHKTATRTIVVEDLKIKAAVRIAKCCSPEPEDQIIGFYTTDNKVTVHKTNCSNIISLEHVRKINVRWSEEKKERTTGIKIIVTDRVGLLAEILNIIAESKINVTSINTDYLKEKININIELSYSNAEQLEDALLKIRKVQNVFGVHFAK